MKRESFQWKEMQPPPFRSHFLHKIFLFVIAFFSLRWREKIAGANPRLD